FGGRMGLPNQTQEAWGTASGGVGGSASGGGISAGASASGTASAGASAAGAGVYAKGKIYAFFANWADQCKGINPLLNQLASVYGNSVDIVRVDVENPDSDRLVDQFKIGPIPTVVFVAPNGQVSSTIIGESNYGNYEAAVRTIVR